MAKLPKEAIPTAIANKTLIPRRILHFMKVNQSHLSDDENLQQTLAALPIFPTKSGEKPLTELSLPGDFDDDPLGVANLVDLDVLDGDREFFRLLNAKELTFETYVSQHVVRELENESLGPDEKRALVRFLADNLELVDELDEATRKSLFAATLIECTDAVFRKAEEVYFPSDEVRKLLGSDVVFTNVEATSTDAISEFYVWLGVATEPRAPAIGARIRAVTATPPTEVTVALISEAIRKQTSCFIEEIRQPRRN